MKKFLLFFCLQITFISAFAQQFSQYNTGTLYESFENPSVRSFVPDSSRQYAFNFFIPNFNTSGFLSGDAQIPIKTRTFKYYYNTTPLQVGNNRYNYGYASAAVYSIMFKLFTSLDGNQEVGFFAKSVGEARTTFSDESVALLNGPAKFNNSIYNDIFNDKYKYQAYHQFGFTYREEIDKKLSIGLKVSALLGITYSDFKVDHSSIAFNNENNTADLGLAGTYRSTGAPGHFSVHDILPTLRNPGAGISMGITYKTDDNIIIQGNLKDVGFIHWATNSQTTAFDRSATINNLTGPHREDSIYVAVHNIVHKSASLTGAFATPTDGKLEASASKSFWIDDDKSFKYSPTLIASKSLVYTDFTAALLNRFNYNNYSLSLLTSYNDMRYFNLGLQFMVKSANAEFFIGSEAITKSGQLALAELGSSTAINQASSFTGADIYLGFSLKFGAVIEHPMNASSIPMGEKGFFGRLYNRLFKTDK